MKKATCLGILYFILRGLVFLNSSIPKILLNFVATLFLSAKTLFTNVSFLTPVPSYFYRYGHM